MTSLAPREARWKAMARPIPREDPVTMATRPSSGSESEDFAAAAEAVVIAAAVLVAMIWRGVV